MPPEGAHLLRAAASIGRRAHRRPTHRCDAGRKNFSVGRFFRIRRREVDRRDARRIRVVPGGDGRLAARCANAMTGSSTHYRRGDDSLLSRRGYLSLLSLAIGRSLRLVLDGPRVSATTRRRAKKKLAVIEAAMSANATRFGCPLRRRAASGTEGGPEAMSCKWLLRWVTDARPPGVC
jgi:hypothetical protein